MSTTPGSSSTKSPLDAAQKIVAELDGMPEDDQALALRFATETLRLPLLATQAQTPHAQAHSPQTTTHTTPVAPGNGTDIKSFTTAKAPKSDQQFAAVVAYYYLFEAPVGQRKDSIDAATMREAARMAARRQVNDWRKTLENARRSGYLDKAERGAFRLNAVGENLVAMTLPDNAAPGNSGGSKKKPAARNKKLKAKKA